MGLLDPSNIPELGVIMGLLNGRDPNWSMRMQQLAVQKQFQQQKEAELKMQQESHGMGMQANQMRMDEARRNQALQEQMRGAAGAAFAPPSEAQGPMPSGQGAPMLPGGGGMPDFARRAMAIDPLEGMKFMPKPSETPFGKIDPHNYDPQSVQAFMASGGKDYSVLRPKAENWQNPDYVKTQKDIRAAGATRVNVNNAQETEFNKKIGGHYAEQFNNLLTGAGSANNQLRDLQRFENIVSKVPTGKLEPLKAEVSRLATSLGVKFDEEKLKTMGFQDALESMSNQFALTLRNPEGGAGMPGALSDKDREFLVSMVPTLSKTPQGNQLIIEGFKRVAQRKIEVAKLAREYKARTGKFDEGFFDVLEQRFGGQDLLGDLYEKAGGISAPAAPVSAPGVLDWNALPKRKGAF